MGSASRSAFLSIFIAGMIAFSPIAIATVALAHDRDAFDTPPISNSKKKPKTSRTARQRCEKEVDELEADVKGLRSDMRATKQKIEQYERAGKDTHQLEGYLRHLEARIADLLDDIEKKEAKCRAMQ